MENLLIGAWLFFFVTMHSRVYVPVLDYEQQFKQEMNVFSFCPVQGDFRNEFKIDRLFPSGTAPVFEQQHMYILNENGQLCCRDMAKNGEAVWTSERKRLSWTPILSGGLAINGTNDGWIVAHDLKTGRERWSRYIDKVLDEPIVHNGNVVAMTSRFISILNLADGSPLWEQYAQCHFSQQRPVAYKDTLLIAGCSSHSSKALYAYKLAENPSKKQP